MKTSGFRGCSAPGTSSLTCSRLFFHSLLAKPTGREAFDLGISVHGRGGIGRPGYAARPAGDRMID